MGHKRNLALWIGGLLGLLLLSAIVSITLGSVHLPVKTTLGILIGKLPLVNMHPTWTQAQATIVWELRMPRVFLALLVGAMLSTSGVAFQGILRNPLADPYILGVSSGGALGAAIFIVLFHDAGIGKFTLPVFSFIGALLSLGAVLALANQQGQRSGNTLILAGIVIQSLVGAFLSFLIAVSGQQMQEIVFWMMGSLANRDWSDVTILIPYFAVGLLYLSFQFRELNILSLGERAAAHLGVDVEKKKIRILIVSSLLAGSAVSVVGIIGFVGLIVPHLMRLIVGPDHRVLFPVSIIAGATFLLWSDTLARTLIESREIPIGVVTAFVGAPFFAYLLKRGLRRGTI